MLSFPGNDKTYGRRDPANFGASYSRARRHWWYCRRGRETETSASASVQLWRPDVADRSRGSPRGAWRYDEATRPVPLDPVEARTRPWDHLAHLQTDILLYLRRIAQQLTLAQGHVPLVARHANPVCPSARLTPTFLFWSIRTLSFFATYLDHSGSSKWNILHYP